MCAYVKAVCGAGGKSTYIKKTAMACAAMGKRVVVTTTTHIFNDRDYDKFENIRLLGRPVEQGKLGALSPEEYKKCCAEADIVLVEADGSRRMPIKLPADYEPVIPENADEIVVVMGAHAIGRRMGTVCHRFELIKENELKSMSEPCEAEFSDDRISDDIIVDENIIRYIAEKYYIKPLKNKYPGKKISFFLSDMRKDFLSELVSGKENRELRINLVMTASGYGRRFGKNKLLESYKGKPLFLNTLDNIVGAAGLLGKILEEDNDEIINRTNGERSLKAKLYITVVTRYDEILNFDYATRYDEVRYGKGTYGKEGGQIDIRPVFNPDYAEGIAGSVRIGAKVSRELNADSVCYFVADQPELDSRSIADFLKYYIYSGKDMAAMYTDGHMSNPAALSSDCFCEIESLEGDRGCMSILKRNPEKVFIYQIESKKLKDVDEPCDMR